MITLTQLEYIVAIDTYRHFGKAADHSAVTQPTLSMQVKKLEEDLEVVIFDRTKHPLVPTPVGRLIIDQARIVLQQTEVVNEIIRDHKSKVEGVLNIGIIPTVAPYLIPRFVRAFKEQFPDVLVKIIELTTSSIVEQLSRGLIDAGILATPLANDKFTEIPLYYEKLSYYGSPTHKLSLKETLNTNDISVSDLWLLSDGHCFRNQIINLCSRRTLENSSLPFLFEAGSIETLINIIDRDGGITIIPELAVENFDSEKKKRVREFNDVVPVREISIIHTKHYAKTAQIKRLVRCIKDSMPEEMLDNKRGAIVELN